MHHHQLANFKFFEGLFWVLPPSVIIWALIFYSYWSTAG